MGRMLDYRAFLEKGVLPKAGGLNDQHPLYVAAMLKILQAEGKIYQLSKPKKR